MDVTSKFEDDDSVQKLFTSSERSEQYKTWQLYVLKRNNSCRILDAACGKGEDSIFLIEQGMEVVSSDVSETLLNYAKLERDRRQLKNWEIKQANWLSLTEDLSKYGLFDAVFCIGNSLLSFLDSSPNFDQYRQCFENFKSMLKPGGILVLDHRNMDVIMDHGQPINKNIYYEQNAIGGLTATITPGKPDVVNVTYDMLHCGQDAKSDKIIHKVTVPLQAIRTQLVT
ncbi:glycine N-methyltransferase-like [Lytechinus variegatus]|uniref:glycine N-methyltransferase-like n=1 Tax=Lytechinus variegatus TaxID=7654 RepID=UPI001BB19EEB|nr:glycine N-methyltransferase-like [Lytechinus variegatus]